MDDQLHHQHQHQTLDDDSDLASAVGAAAAAHQHQLGLDDIPDSNEEDHTPHHSHYALQQPDFTKHENDNNNHVHNNGVDLNDHQDQDQGQDDDVDVHGLDIPTVDDEDLDLRSGDDLDLSMGMENQHDLGDTRGGFGLAQGVARPPSIRKACDLCHGAKQKCSGDRPTCTRCAAGGWDCNYAPRQRRRTVPKELRGTSVIDTIQRNPVMSVISQMALPQMSSLLNSVNNNNKKRKLGQRGESLPGGFGEGIDLQRAMGMAMDMGLAGEEEGEDMQSMDNEQMLESIAVDGYLADLPLGTFVHNLPYTAPPAEPVQFNPEDFPTGDMDQHTTSALRDAIFSLNESGGGAGGHTEANGEHHDGDGHEGEMDPHLALLDLSMPGEEGNNNNNEVNNDTAAGLLNQLNASFANSICNHTILVPHILSLLNAQPLEPKAGTNTPLTLSVFAPLSRSLRLFNTLTNCSACSTSPHQTLPQLALLSRTTTILTFPFPPLDASSVGSSAQISIHGARLAGTGISEAIESHIVGVIWDSWRAAIREIFGSFERKAQDVITQTAMASETGQAPPASSAETQRAGLMFQAMSRLVTAMDEVEGN